MPCPAREEFQIGWICALPIEAAAAKEMLDEDFGILEEQDVADTNSYRLGRIGKHYVVIACLPAGQYGACAATTVASNMVRTFSKSLRIGLMVGVGGGIPSPDHDIRLDDIVISCPGQLWRRDSVWYGQGHCGRCILPNRLFKRSSQIIVNSS
jgi:nucleoside phosphorylase